MNNNDGWGVHIQIGLKNHLVPLPEYSPPMDTPVAEIDFFSFFIMIRVVLGWGVLLSLLTRQ